MCNYSFTFPALWLHCAFQHTLVIQHVLLNQIKIQPSLLKMVGYVANSFDVNGNCLARLCASVRSVLLLLLSVSESLLSDELLLVLLLPSKTFCWYCFSKYLKESSFICREMH